MEPYLPATTTNETEAAPLRLLDCARCQEPMYHRRGEVLASYPLTSEVAYHCGECGLGQSEWEDVAPFIRWPGAPSSCAAEGK
jgi:hypothetical protein